MRIPTKKISVPDHVEIGRIIRKLRIKKYLSLEKLSDKMGIHLSHLSLLERGKRDWTEENIERAERVLRK